MSACPCGALHTAEDHALALPSIFTTMVPSQRGRFELEPSLDDRRRVPRGRLAEVRSCRVCGTLYAIVGAELGARFEPGRV